MAKEQQLVVVRVGEGFYGLDVQSIKEIVKPRTVTPVPHAPFFVEGLMNLRGQIVTVINLEKKLLSLQAHVEANDLKGKAERIVVVNQNDELIGLRVDAVEQVFTIDSDKFEHPDATATKEQKVIDGVVQINENLVMKIDTNVLLRPIGEKEERHE